MTELMGAESIEQDQHVGIRVWDSVTQLTFEPRRCRLTDEPELQLGNKIYEASARIVGNDDFSHPSTLPTIRPPPAARIPRRVPISEG